MKKKSWMKKKVADEKKRRCFFQATVLSPNCCAVTIFEYSTTEVTLTSCLSAPSKHVAQSKWQSADLDLVKLAKKRKIKVCGQRYSKVTCAFSLIKFLTSVPF